MQRLGTLALWYERGFREVTTDFGVELRDMPLGDGYAQINGGRLLAAPLLPNRSAVSAAASRSIYPLQGGRLRYIGSRSQWTLFAGRAKRFRELLGQESRTPILYGIRHLRRIGVHHLGFSFTGVNQPTFVSARGAQRLTGVVSGTYYRDLAPEMGVLAELHTTGASFGGRVGSLFRFPAGQIATML